MLILSRLKARTGKKKREQAVENDEAEVVQALRRPLRGHPRDIGDDPLGRHGERPDPVDGECLEKSHDFEVRYDVCARQVSRGVPGRQGMMFDVCRLPT